MSFVRGNLHCVKWFAGPGAAPQTRRCPSACCRPLRQKGLEPIPDQAIHAGFVRPAGRRRCSRPGWFAAYPLLLDGPITFRAAVAMRAGIGSAGSTDPGRPIPGCGCGRILANKQAPRLLGALLASGGAGLAGAGARPSPAGNRDSLLAACPELPISSAARWADLPEALARPLPQLAQVSISQSPASAGGGPQACGRWLGAVSAGQPAPLRQNSGKTRRS